MKIPNIILKGWQRLRKPNSEFRQTDGDISQGLVSSQVGRRADGLSEIWETARLHKHVPRDSILARFGIGKCGSISRFTTTFSARSRSHLIVTMHAPHGPVLQLLSPSLRKTRFKNAKSNRAFETKGFWPLGGRSKNNGSCSYHIWGYTLVAWNRFCCHGM